MYRRFGQTSDEFEHFKTKFNELCSSIKSEDPFCTVYTGDFNAHLSEWWDGDVSDDFGTSLQNVFNSYGLHQLVNQPTYVTDKSSSCIDLIITDQPNMFLDNDIHPSLHTNCRHQINFAELNVQCSPPPPYPRRVWHYDRANVNAIKRSIEDFDWDGSLDACTCIDEQVKILSDVVTNVFTNFTPFSDILINPKEPPWLTKTIKTIYNKYKKKYRMFIKYGRKRCDKVE